MSRRTVAGHEKPVKIMERHRPAKVTRLWCIECRAPANAEKIAKTNGYRLECGHIRMLLTAEKVFENTHVRPTKEETDGTHQR